MELVPDDFALLLEELFLLEDRLEDFFPDLVRVDDDSGVSLVLEVLEEELEELEESSDVEGSEESGGPPLPFL